jgi:hypothetical protein
VSYSWQLADKSHTAPAFLTFAGRLIRSAGRIGLHNPQTTTSSGLWPHGRGGSSCPSARRLLTKEAGQGDAGMRRGHAGFGRPAIVARLFVFPAAQNSARGRIHVVDAAAGHALYGQIDIAIIGHVLR